MKGRERMDFIITAIAFIGIGVAMSYVFVGEEDD